MLRRAGEQHMMRRGAYAKAISRRPSACKTPSSEPLRQGDGDARGNPAEYNVAAEQGDWRDSAEATHTAEDLGGV